MSQPLSDKTRSLIRSGVDVAPLLAEIDAHPELWNQHPMRKAAPANRPRPRL